MKHPPRNPTIPRPQPCVSCGLPCVGGQRNDDGWPEHYECTKQASAGQQAPPRPEGKP